MTEAVIDPLDVLDYCSSGCTGEGTAITVWDGDTCVCCGGAWGEPTPGRCRDLHIQGAEWKQALEDEQ